MGTKRYAYRAYPTPGQQHALSRLFGCVRVVYNDFIAARRQAHADKTPFEGQTVLQSRLVVQAKSTPQRAWLAEVSSTPLEQATRDADRAYRNFFDSLSGKRKGRKMGVPRFRSRRDHRQTARFTRSAGFAVRQTSHGVGKVRVPKVGWVRFELSRPLPSDPSSVTVIRQADGTHHVSFVVEAPSPQTTPTSPGRAVGIDMGLTDFATVVATDGTRTKVANPRHLRAAERALTKAQRSLSRKTKGSANRGKARLRVAKTHSRVRRTRLDFHHQVASRLIRENQAVAVEALVVGGLARAGAKNAQGRGLRRSVHDAGWGQFLRVLAEKAADHGRTFTSVNPAYTSQTCSVCGVLDGPKPLGVREWTCGGCGARLDRDYNAAVNVMVAAGLAETENACGADVRRTLACAVSVEAGTHRGEVAA